MVEHRALTSVAGVQILLGLPDRKEIAMGEKVVIYDLCLVYGVQYEGKGYIDMPLGRHTIEVQHLPERIAAPLQVFIQTFEEIRAKKRE